MLAYPDYVMIGMHKDGTATLTTQSAYINQRNKLAINVIWSARRKEPGLSKLGSLYLVRQTKLFEI